MKDLLLPNIVSQKDEKPHTAGLNDRAILHIKIKITDTAWKKAQHCNTVIPHVPPHRPNPGMSQMLLLIKLDWFLAFFIALQRAMEVVSDCLRLVDFAIGLVNSVLNSPYGQVTFFGEFMHNGFQARWNDFWANTCQLQLARMASCRTDFLCTLHRLIFFFLFHHNFPDFVTFAIVFKLTFFRWSFKVFRGKFFTLDFLALRWMLSSLFNPKF